MVAPISGDAKATMLANLELEVNARRQKLQLMSEAQCASLLSRLERRVNRVPASKRAMTIDEFFNPFDIMEPDIKEVVEKKREDLRKRNESSNPRNIVKSNIEEQPQDANPAPAPAKAAPNKKAATTKKAPVKKTAPASIPAPALAPAPKTRAAPAATTSTSRAATVKAAPAPKPTMKSRHAPSKSVPTTSTRAKKRSSDEATTTTTSDDKENVSSDLAVSKKRVRAATTTTKQAAVSKPAAPATRSTRAASRKTAPADVLSPKNDNVKAPSSRAKSAASNTRPR
ncbi:hypothetical protein N0V86_001993 [Didymella sp. IMI 355093]|nr:hypothetical protein N0V86_001993 [Didymella sp. IMI 355093]